MKKFFGFTLAEVLITLGVIGVVAAITIPSLVAKHNEKATVIKVKHTYSILNEAVRRAIVENGTVDNWTSQNDAGSRTKDIVNILLQYVNTVQKNCIKGTQDICFAPEYTNKFTNNKWRPSNWVQPAALSFILSNGVSVDYYSAVDGSWCRLSANDILDNQYNNINIGYWRYSGHCGTIYIDINGLKGPNKDGVDLFGFFLFKDGIVPRGRKGDHFRHNFENNCMGKSFAEAGSCSAWVIYNENMDYLHCDDLSWNEKTSCK